MEDEPLFKTRMGNDDMRKVLLCNGF